MVKLTNDELWQIGKDNFLYGRKMDDFMKFFKLRFPHHIKNAAPDYADTWASRFSSGTEWCYSDLESKRALIKINPKYREDRQMIKKYGGWN